MAILKKKLSKSGWILIGLVVVLIIALPILHFTGVIDLSFIGTVFLSVKMYGAADVVSGVLESLIWFGLGIGTLYILKNYILGTQISAAAAAQSYIPRGDLPQTTAPNEEVTVT
jgi:uncharacterized membrane protein